LFKNLRWANISKIKGFKALKANYLWVIFSKVSTLILSRNEDLRGEGIFNKFFLCF